MELRTVLLISSDHVGWGDLRATLAAMPDVQVLGDVTDISQARRLAVAHEPDVIIAEALLTSRSIVPLLVELHHDCCSASKTIVFASHYEPSGLRVPEEAGIVGYLLWSDLTCAMLRHALALLLTGDIILGSSTVVRAFIDSLREQVPQQAAALEITEREQAVLRRMAAGLTYEEIARVEAVSRRTVERLVNTLERKLDAANHFALAMKAVQLGLVR